MASYRVCVKPGCGDPAAALLSYDHAGRTAWLDETGLEGGWALCSAHAGRLSVPNGWVRVDRRRMPHALAS